MQWIHFLLLRAYRGVAAINPFRRPVDQTGGRIAAAARA
jgi:hypothetical protein